jgi:subtilase family serine protease
VKRILIAFALIAALAGMTQLRAQNNGNGNGNSDGNGVVIVPGSSIENPGDAGHKSHTNHLIFLRGQGKQTYLSGLSPAQIRTAYKLTDGTGAGIIAIVDAFHYKNAYADLKTFSTNYGIPILPQCGDAGPTALGRPCFWQVYADLNGSFSTSASAVPPVNCGWNQEAALDIEWAHAMAPNASIVLVEAQSNYNNALFPAVRAAASIFTARGMRGEVSMSWGSGETSGESAYDSNFSLTGNGVVYFASSGDTGGKTIYPGVSPYVISAGGTTLNMTSSGFQSETGWSGSGGGLSAYEPMLTYQNPVANLLGGKRGVPDFSFDADPSTGVLVWGPTCSGSNTGLMIFGGTSVSAPSLAGIVNSASASVSGFATDTYSELGRLYSNLPGSGNGPYAYGNFRDVTSGRAGKNNSAVGWDFVTGIGSSLGLAGK